MARYFEEENEDDEVVVRKRRRPIKKPVAEDDDEEDVRGGKNKNIKETDDDYDDEEDDLLPSTGFVLLDIVLDYWDDYVYWSKEHFAAGVVVGVFCFLLFFVPMSLFTLYIYNYINRPTLQKALDAYDFGAYGEAGKFAETVLKYTARNDDRTRAGVLFVLGASACSIAEMTSGGANDSPKKNYYLAAAKYLSDCRELGYYPGRKAEAAFMLGKSLFLADEFVKAREPLLVSLENESPNKKMLYWYLANSYMLSPDANTTEADKFVKLFQAEETITDEELFESDLLGAMIQVYSNNPDAAEKILRKVPQFDQYSVMKTFIKGQIAFLRANTLRLKSLAPATQQPQTTPNNNNNNNNNNPIIPSIDNYPSPALLPDNNSSFDKTKKTHNNDYFALHQKFPRGVTAIPPIDLEDKNSIYLRITYLSQIESANPPSTSTSPSSSPSSTSSPSSPSPFPSPSSTSPSSTSPSSLPSAFSPDAVIVLPPEPPVSKAESDLLPEGEFSDGGFFPPSGIDSELLPNDPLSGNSRKMKELAQQKFREAIEYFREVRRNDLFDKKWLRTAELLEGKCNEEIGELSEAKNRYRQINEVFSDTDEAAAADFFYAEIERNAGRFEDVLSIYNRAFETLRKNPDYACHWFTKKEISQKTMEILQWLMRRRDYKTGIIFLSIVRDIVELPDAAKFRGEFYENWGKELYQQSLTQKENQPIGGEHESSYVEKFRRAGEAFSELARYQFGERTYDQQIWRCAENFRLGKDNKHGIEAYNVYLRVNKVDRQAEALLYVGEMYINLGMIDDAITNLESAIVSYPRDALISRIRLTLSHAYNEKREFEKAKQLLISNLIEGSYDPSSIVYSDSVYLLAKLSYEQGNTGDAIVYLEDALKIHPNAPQAAEAHYFVSRSYLTRAETTLGMMKDAAQINEVRNQIQNSVLNDRVSALEHIQMAERLLLQRRDTRELAESELIMLRNTMFGAGKIMMLLEQYEKAVAAFNMVATRYQEPASLDALLQIAIAYRQLNRKDDAVAALNRAEMLLQQFEESDTIAKGTDWAAKIQVQKKIMNNE
ncbi:MAG: tetratricopeptide repeat protein [Planctomycetaceae bacterium]|jgi:tetratricopeptide (TPR) repeat protein|nr:tetratricopeptide repeat protein [Planctomycetaceae bacterium]